MAEVKICGITTLADAFFAAEAGADALGFIFYPKSPRYVTPEAAKAMIQKVPGRTAKVGVFVNHDSLLVREIFTFCGLDLVQLHGDESPEYCGQFASSRVIKAVSLRKESDVERLDGYPVRAILVDAFDPNLYGGTGKRADWRLAAKVKDRFSLILAGGLHMKNIREAVEILSPHAVDINSGVERVPGRKDPKKVRTIIQIVRQVNRSEASLFQSVGRADLDTAGVRT